MGAKIAEANRKRGAYQDQQAEGIIKMNELRAKLVDLEETRETAEPELTALRNRAGRIERLERKAEAILEHHARITAGR